MELLLLILVRIHKLYIVYLEIYVVLIGHGFSFFFGHGKSMLKKRGHPGLRIYVFVRVGKSLEFWLQTSPCQLLDLLSVLSCIIDRRYTAIVCIYVFNYCMLNVLYATCLWLTLMSVVSLDFCSLPGGEWCGKIFSSCHPVLLCSASLIWWYHAGLGCFKPPRSTQHSHPYVSTPMSAPRL